MDLADGYYSYDLPRDEETPERVSEGALTWRYDGQEVYLEEKESELDRTGSWTVPDEVIGTALVP